MPTVRLVTPFEIGDTVISTIDIPSNGHKALVIIYGVIVRIDFKYYYSEGKPISEPSYSVLDSNAVVHDGLTLDKLQTVGYFIKHEKYRLTEVAEKRKVFIKSEGGENACKI